MPPSDPIIEELLAALRSDKISEEDNDDVKLFCDSMAVKMRKLTPENQLFFQQEMLVKYSEYFRRQNQPQTPNSHFNIGSFDMAHQPTTPTTPYGHAPQARQSNTPQSLRSSYSGMTHQCMPPLLHQWRLMVLNILRLVDSDYLEHNHDICRFNLWS